MFDSGRKANKHTHCTVPVSNAARFLHLFRADCVRFLFDFKTRDKRVDEMHVGSVVFLLLCYIAEVDVILQAAAACRL